MGERVSPPRIKFLPPRWTVGPSVAIAANSFMPPLHASSSPLGCCLYVFLSWLVTWWDAPMPHPRPVLAWRICPAQNTSQHSQHSQHSQPKFAYVSLFHDTTHDARPPQHVSLFSRTHTHTHTYEQVFPSTTRTMFRATSSAARRTIVGTPSVKVPYVASQSDHHRILGASWGCGANAWDACTMVTGPALVLHSKHSMRVYIQGRPVHKRHSSFSFPCQLQSRRPPLRHLLPATPRSVWASTVSAALGAWYVVWVCVLCVCVAPPWKHA